MNKIKLINNFAFLVLKVILPVICGFRLADLYLMYDNRAQGELISSERVTLEDNSKLWVIHPKQYSINSKGSSTYVLVGDSMGVGSKCANNKNIAGCLRDLSEKHIVNLSEPGVTPATYLKKTKQYINLQRDMNSQIKGDEVVFVVLTANDILFDKEKCNYYFANQFKLDKLNIREKEYISNSCAKIMTKSWVNISNNDKNLGLKSIFKPIIGSNSARVLQGGIGSLALAFDLPTSGRSSYAKKWGTLSPELKLNAFILADMKNFCISQNCNVIFTFFPNVEDISKDSKIYSSVQFFSSYMKKKFGIYIHNGYSPFLNKGIRRATYSLSNGHGSCEAYKIYANWLINLSSPI